MNSLRLRLNQQLLQFQKSFVTSPSLDEGKEHSDLISHRQIEGKRKWTRNAKSNFFKTIEKSALGGSHTPNKKEVGQCTISLGTLRKSLAKPSSQTNKTKKLSKPIISSFRGPGYGVSISSAPIFSKLKKTRFQADIKKNQLDKEFKLPESTSSVQDQQNVYRGVIKMNRKIDIGYKDKKYQSIRFDRTRASKQDLFRANQKKLIGIKIITREIDSMQRSFFILNKFRFDRGSMHRNISTILEKNNASLAVLVFRDIFCSFEDCTRVNQYDRATLLSRTILCFERYKNGDFGVEQFFTDLRNVSTALKEFTSNVLVEHYSNLKKESADYLKHIFNDSKVVTIGSKGLLERSKSADFSQSFFDGLRLSGSGNCINLRRRIEFLGFNNDRLAQIDKELLEVNQVMKSLLQEVGEYQ